MNPILKTEIPAIITLQARAEKAEAELVQLRAQEGDYIKIIAEVLKCEQRPACEQPDNQLEAPWEVVARLRAQNDQFSDNLSAVGKAYNAEKDRAEKAEAEVERLTKHCSALEVEVTVLSEGLSEDHAIYIANARAEKAEASLHNVSLDLSTANHMIKLERDRADALQTRLNELDSILKKHNLID
jgi:predicted RNase H-like nuclease (RuvC/YqgF family)